MAKNMIPIDTGDAVLTLDEGMGALWLAHEAVFEEAGTNKNLGAAFASIALSLRSLDVLRDSLADAPLRAMRDAEAAQGVAHG